MDAFLIQVSGVAFMFLFALGVILLVAWMDNWHWETVKGVMLISLICSAILSMFRAIWSLIQ